MPYDGGHAPLPPAPKPAPRGLFSNLGHSIGNVGRSVSRATHSVSTPHTAPQAGSDVQSTHGYDTRRATAFKKTPAYKNAVVQVFRHQPPAQKKAILKGAVSRPSHEGGIVLNYVHNLLKNDPFNADLKGLIHGGSGSDVLGIAGHAAKSIYSLTNPMSLGKTATGPTTTPADRALLRGAGTAAHGADLGLKALNTGLRAIHAQSPAPAGKLSAAGFGAGALGDVAVHAPIDIARATLQDPSVLPKTAKGLADSVVGAVAGGVQLPINIATQGPGTAVSNLVHAQSKDWSRRYGPLVAGNDQAFIHRIKQEGAGPEAFDAFALAGGADATLGRAFSGLAKSREALTGHPNFLTRERPDLLLSGGKARPQKIAPTAIRATAQRVEDRMRAARTARRPGELRPAEHQVAPIFQDHAMRVVHSGIAQFYRRQIQDHLTAEVRGKAGSANHEIGKLTADQRRAVFHAIHGVRMDTAEHLRADLADRRAAILRDRANPKSLGNRIPEQHRAQVDELALIDKLLGKADKIAGPKMVAFQKAEAARAARIEATTNLHPATAEARRLRPLGDKLGIVHPDEGLKAAETKAAEPVGVGVGGELAAARASAQAEKLASLPRAERLAAYVQEVRAAMANHKDPNGASSPLPEPGYFKHTDHPKTDFAAYASGAGEKAQAADKFSKWALYKAGVAHHDTQAYLDGLARSIKRPYQWRMTTHQFDAAAFPTPLRSEIKAALGRDKSPALLTGHELRQVLAHKGHDMSQLAFYNPGRLSEQVLAEHDLLTKQHQGKLLADAHAEQTNSTIRDALQQKDTVAHGDQLGSNDKFLSSPGWKAIPKTAYDEIAGGLKGNSLGGRLVGKAQGTQAGLILAQNPHFLIMNTLAHGIPALVGTKGALLHSMAQTPFWYHGLSDADKRLVDARAGGRAGHYAQTAKFGSTAPNQIAGGWRKLTERGIVQKIQTVNPLHAVMRAEDIQSQYWRRTVMHNELKRSAFQDLSHEYGHAVRAAEQIKHIFTVGPKDRMNATLHDMPKVEELGRSAINLLGDYGRFTNRERAFLNNKAVLFYSFLRHVTRTLLYVLPVRHPLAFGLMGELGNLHVEEVKKLLGGQDLPWAYGRLFFGGQGGKKLKSIDLTSTSPISSPLVDILSGGVKEAPRLLSPMLANALDVAYGTSPQGQPIKQNAWSLVNNLMSLSYPYRMAAVFHHGLKPQQSDSVPFLHDRPQVLKTKSAQAYQAEKTAARGPTKDYMLGSLLGLYPKPDDSQVIAGHRGQKAAAHQRNLAKKSSKSGSSSGGGYLMGGDGSSSGGGSGYLMP